jgi:hypothetical protein
LALNIVHAVEFSRNGRTRITALSDRSAGAVSFSPGHPMRMDPDASSSAKRCSSRLGIFVPLEAEKLFALSLLWGNE